MPKAILELPEMPESCWECPILCCDIPDKGKRSDCPLKLVEVKEVEKE